MARSKSSVEERKQLQQAEMEKKAEAARRKLTPLPWLALALLLAVLLLNFLHWTDIYNTDIAGVEVSASGIAYAAAGITGDYTSTARIYGDLAVPFYYYSDYWCEGSWCATLSTLTLAAIGVTLAAVALTLICGIAKKYALSLGGALLACASGGLYLACHFKALSMKDAQILAIYCNYNPACSIRSYALVPALASFLTAAFFLFLFVKYCLSGRTPSPRK